jgi:hypothetical protein
MKLSKYALNEPGFGAGKIDLKAQTVVPQSQVDSDLERTLAEVNPFIIPSVETGANQPLSAQELEKASAIIMDKDYFLGFPIIKTPGKPGALKTILCIGAAALMAAAGNAYSQNVEYEGTDIGSAITIQQTQSKDRTALNIVNILKDHKKYDETATDSIEVEYNQYGLIVRNYSKNESNTSYFNEPDGKGLKTVVRTPSTFSKEKQIAAENAAMDDYKTNRTSKYFLSLYLFDKEWKYKIISIPSGLEKANKDALNEAEKGLAEKYAENK